MASAIIILSCLAVTATAIAVPIKTVYAEPEAPAHYEFSYSVEDQHTGDMKEQHENRAGDAVHGTYSLLQPDGMKRIVEYTSDKEHGFNAIVRYESHSAPQPHHAALSYAQAPLAKIAYAPAPIAKVAYAPAITKVAYTPPAKIAYPTKVLAAPVAKVAYAQPLGHVTFSSPAISYHH